MVVDAPHVRDWVLIGLAVAAFAVGLVRQDMAVVTVGAGLLGTPALLGGHGGTNGHVTDIPVDEPVDDGEPVEEYDDGSEVHDDPVVDPYAEPQETPWEWAD